MNPKASATLEKACEDRRRSNFKKALSRLEEGIGKFPGELRLHTEAIDVGMEAGESLKAIQLFKRAQQKFPDDAFELWTFTAERVGAYNDPIVGRFLLEQAIKNGDLAAASSILDNLKDHTVGELLDRIRTKKQTMSLALGTGLGARSELVSYALTEAMLAFRLGRFAEAMDGIVSVLDENPALSKTLEPFLAELERQHGDIAETIYTLGCCYLAEADFPRAIEKLGRAAKISRALAPAAIQRLESIGDHPQLSPDNGLMTLAELYIGQGECQRASDLLRAILERSPARSADVVDILRPAVGEIREHLDLHFTFVDASLAAGRRETAFGQLRKIYRDPNHRSRLIEWLDSRMQSGGGAPELRLFFAETALTEGLHGKAIEIVKEILSHGSQEEPAAKELLSKFQSVPVVRQFYSETFRQSSLPEGDSNFEVERYDSHGFVPRDVPPAQEDSDEPRVAARETAHAARDAHFRVDEFSFGEGAERPGDPNRPFDSDIDNRDFSLSMHGAAPTGENKPAPTEETGQSHIPESEQPTGENSDLFDYLKRDFTNREQEEAFERPDSPAEDVGEPNGGTEGPVREPASETPEADRASPGPGGEEPAPLARDEERTLPGTDTTETAAEETEPSPEPTEEPRDFDSLYRLFLDGKLDRARTLDTIERAFEEGRMEEMKKLLSFEPANLGEDIARKYQLARYYLAMDQPLPALVALRSVHLGAVSKEERKNLLLRIAECYRALYNFEAAHAVYLRIMSEHPGLSDVEQVAQSNYASHIETAAGAAPALEKVTTL